MYKPNEEVVKKAAAEILNKLTDDKLTFGDMQAVLVEIEKQIISRAYHYIKNVDLEDVMKAEYGSYYTDKMTDKLIFSDDKEK